MIDITRLEQRLNLQEETCKIIRYMGEYDRCFGDNNTMWGTINNSFKHWEKRGLALNSYEYLKYQNVSILSNREIFFPEENTLNDKDCYFVLLFICNYICDMIITESDEEISIRVKTIFQNITSIMEKSNYQLKFLEDRIIACKRDANVDSVIQLTGDKSLTELLLSYLDMTIHDDVNEKAHILMQLFKYVEKDKVIYINADNKLKSSVFALYNKLEIRHNDKKQIELLDKDKLKWYDILFQLTLHLVRVPYIKEMQNEVKELTNNK